jgi:hypothetical protein
MSESGENTVGRDDLLLLMAKGAEDGSYPFDAIRAMKSAFLVSERGLPEWQLLYNFRPYDYGPFDSSVYVSRDVLVAGGLLEERPGNYPSYRLTEAGHARAREIAERMGSASAAWLEGIGKWASSRSFAQLLREVYAEFPQFASRSIARVS